MKWIKMLFSSIFTCSPFPAQQFASYCNGYIQIVAWLCLNLLQKREPWQQQWEAYMGQWLQLPGLKTALSNCCQIAFCRNQFSPRPPLLSSVFLACHLLGVPAYRVEKAYRGHHSPSYFQCEESRGLKKTGLLDAWDDEYGGVIMNSESLPMSANAFASAFQASLSNWKMKGKRGVWLKILQADLVPIAIQEGFNYHHAEPGYVMLTYWIPNEPCMLPASPSHQIGIAGFVINDKREVLVVKEKCPCSCSGVWKLPTGYINKSEDIFSGAIREVREETGVDTTFLKMVAFRHAHLVAFEQSDLLFVCMLKPLSYDITIDDKEIQAAKVLYIMKRRGGAYQRKSSCD